MRARARARARACACACACAREGAVVIQVVGRIRSFVIGEMYSEGGEEGDLLLLDCCVLIWPTGTRRRVADGGGMDVSVEALSAR